MTTSTVSQKHDARATRVTAEEFSEAVTALEARRLEQARHVQNTVAIGAVVDELDLDITAEEILAEVHAQRATRQQRRARPRFVWDTLLLAIFLGSAIWLVRTLDAGMETATLTSTEPRDVRVAVGGGRTSIVKTLSEIPDGQAVLCSDAALDELLVSGHFSSEQSVADEAEGRWILLKHDGFVYLRGWVPIAMSDRALKAGDLRFYASPQAIRAANAAHRRPPMPLTLKMESIRWNGEGGDGWRTLSDIGLDSHAREEW